MAHDLVKAFDAAVEPDPGGAGAEIELHPAAAPVAPRRIVGQPHPVEFVPADCRVPEAAGGAVPVGPLHAGPLPPPGPATSPPAAAPCPPPTRASRIIAF